MIFKKLAFTILAVSLAASLEAKNPYESTYVERNPYVMQLLQKAGISVNFRSGKTFQDYVFEAKRNHRVKPHVIREIEDVYKSFYVEGLPAPKSTRDMIARKNEDRHDTMNDSLDRQPTEPADFNHLDEERDDFGSSNNKFGSHAKRSSENLEKLEKAMQLIEEVKTDMTRG